VQQFENSKQHLLTLVNTTDHLTALESLIDVAATPAGTLLTTLRERLGMLAAAIDLMQPDSPLPTQLPTAVVATQNTFAGIVAASSPYAPPYGKISSNHIVHAGLRESIRTIYPQLPKLVLEESGQPMCNLPTLTSDEKRAFLVVARHIDATTLNAANESDESLQAARPEYQQLKDHLASEYDISGDETASGPARSSLGTASQEEFRNIAQRERDEFIDDMIRELDTPRAHALIRSHVEALSSQHPDLMTTLDSALTAAQARLEDRLLRIQCEAGIAGEISDYLARQQIRAVDLHTVSQLLKENPNLEGCCTSIVTQHQSIPSSSAEELSEYLRTLADTLNAAHDLSPLVFESLMYSPSKELTTLNGVKDKAKELCTLIESPEKLKTLEIALLTSLTASLLHRHFPASDHDVAQYTVAAQIVVLGLAPELKGENVERPIRAGREVTKLLNRTTRGNFSVDIVCKTIQDHLLPHLVVCKKHSKRSQGQHEFQIASNPAEILRPVVAHLTYIAMRSLASTTKTPTSQSIGSRPAPSTTPNQSTQTTQEIVQEPLPDTDLRARESQRLLDQHTHLELLAASFNSIQTSLTPQKRVTPATAQTAAEITLIIKRIPLLAARLASSLQNKMQGSVLGSYNHPFDKLCFKRLAEKTGLNSLSSSSLSTQLRNISFDSSKIHEIIFDCLLEQHPKAKAFLPLSKNLVATFRGLEKEIGFVKTILPEDFITQTLSSIERHIAEPLKLRPEGAAALSVFCSWLSNQEFQSDIEQAVAGLSEGLRGKISELSEPPAPRISTIEPPLSEGGLPEDTV